MADVRVGQQDSVRAATESLDLLGEVGSRVDEKALAGGRVEKAERRDVEPLCRIAPGLDAERLSAPRMGNAAVLRDSQDDGLRRAGLRRPGFGARTLQDGCEEEGRGEHASRRL